MAERVNHIPLWSSLPITQVGDLATAVLQAALFLGRAGLNQTRLHSISRHLGPIFQLQLLQNMLDVGLDRIDGDEEGVGYLGIGGPFGHQLQHFHFSLG